MGNQNKDGERLLEFADNFDMVLGDMFFKKDLVKLITLKSAGNSSMIDYVVVKKELIKRIRDVKVIPGEECFSQHRLLVIDLVLKNIPIFCGTSIESTVCLCVAARMWVMSSSWLLFALCCAV